MTPKRTRGKSGVIGAITTAEHDHATIRRKCREGTEKYRIALIAAGHITEPSAFARCTEGQRIAKALPRDGSPLPSASPIQRLWPLWRQLAGRAAGEPDRSRRMLTAPKLILR
jgi:hypothetical protein